MSERQIGIPPDWEWHQDVVFAQADDPPFMWHRDKELLAAAEQLESSTEFLKIGVIDTGYTPHKWLPEPQEVKNFTTDRTSNANNPHGEHVYGMIGGLKGIGLLPKAKFYIAKGLSDSGSGSTSWLNGAIRWMADMGVHFVNGSYGSSQSSPDDAAAQKYFYEVGARNGGGWLLHFAAGNSGKASSNTIGWPAKGGRCSVNGSYDASGGRSSFSSVGSQLQVLGAGGKVFSTIPGDGGGLMSGTSMGSPDNCAKTGLIAVARMGVGLPPLVGPEAWAAEYERMFHAKLIKDGGSPGRDNDYGWGQFTTAAIVEYLNKFIWVAIAAVLLSLFGGGLTAQEQQASRVIPVIVIDAEAAEIISGDGGVSVILDSPGTAKPSAIIATTATNPLVRAYPKANPFPPVRLPKVGEGRYRLDGPPGAEFTVEILATEPEWWSEYLVVRIGAQPPPVTDPDKPPPTDGRDWSEIETWVANNGIPTIDKPTAEKWRTLLQAILPQMTGDDLKAAQALVQEVRRVVISTRQSQTDWSGFMASLEKMVLAAPPKNVAEYKGLVEAMIRGLKR